MLVIILVQIHYTRNNLMEKMPCFIRRETSSGHNVIEELAAGSILHDQVEFFRRLNYLVQLDHVRVLHDLENVYLTLDSLCVRNVLYF